MQVLATNMEEAIIYGSLIGGVFGIIGLLIINNNWFKRQEWKTLDQFKRKKFDLEYKKIMREMGLESKKLSSATTAPSNSLLDNANLLLPLLKNLAPEQLQDIVGMLTGNDQGGAEDQGAPSGLDGLLSFAQQNPELVKGFLDKMKGGGDQTPPPDSFL